MSVVIQQEGAQGARALMEEERLCLKNQQLQR